MGIRVQPSNTSHSAQTHEDATSWFVGIRGELEIQRHSGGTVSGDAVAAVALYSASQWAWVETTREVADSGTGMTVQPTNDDYASTTYPDADSWSTGGHGVLNLYADEDGHYRGVATYNSSEWAWVENQRTPEDDSAS